MSRMVALGAVLGFAVAVLLLALFAKEPPRPPAPPPAATPQPLVQPVPLLRPVALRRDLQPNSPVRAVLPPAARKLVDADAGAAP